MKIHLVGGFLGSGKTTAIIQAARWLIEQGSRVGVITNDQGKYLVDTAFVRLSAIPAVEVGGGCFCCNYTDLDRQLAQLIAASQPQVVFAESVGSCADIVATVLKPLIELGQKQIQPASFSVFADARMLRRRMLGQELPFSDEIIYIFDKQLEEAGIIVINKADLVDQQALALLKEQVAARYPGKVVCLQSSLTQIGIMPWLQLIQSENAALPTQSLSIDYARYGAGEARLAWLDEVATLYFAPGEGQARLRQIIGRLAAELTQRGVGIGHLKFMITGPGVEEKVSLVSQPDMDWALQIPFIPGDHIDLLINARVEIAADDLRGLFQQVLNESGLQFNITSAAAFHPGQPNPTHRFA